jgi:hypothetical protein
MKQKIISAMKKNINWLVGIIIFISTGIFSCEKKVPVQEPVEPEFATAKPPSGPPAPPNNNCTNAIVLTPGDTIHNQTTGGANTQQGEVVSSGCLSGSLKETVWYKFTATAASMYVDAEVTNNLYPCIGDFNFLINVYNTASCVPGVNSMISCQRMGNDLVVVQELTGLTIGNTYLVQAGYKKTNPSCTISPIFKIVVGVTEPSCGICNTPCGSACTFATTPPSHSYVKENCAGDVLIPRLQGNNTGNAVSRTLCYTFTAANTTIDWGFTHNPANITFTWELQSSSCSGVIQSGSMTQFAPPLILGQLTGLTIGTQYTMCFNVTPNFGSWVSKVWPFFVEATP